jgi:rhodanese-related sulfurtransferase
MTRSRFFLFLFGFLFLTSTAVMAQIPIISAKDVNTRMTGKQKVVLIDVRPADEYQAGHIPGAINIPADYMKAEPSRLPKGKSTPLIFYCRGAG